MWIIFGIIVIVATILNFYMYKIGENYKCAMVIGLSFTALTLCSVYTLVSKWIKIKDWSALVDVVPSMETTLWTLTTISIVLNIIPMFLESKKNRYL